MGGVARSNDLASAGTRNRFVKFWIVCVGVVVDVLEVRIWGASLVGSIPALTTEINVFLVHGIFRIKILKAMVVVVGIARESENREKGEAVGINAGEMAGAHAPR